MIVKIQLSTFTTESTPQALIYNKARSFEVQLSAAEYPGLLEVMEGDDKAFFHADLINGQLHLRKRAKEQNW